MRYLLALILSACTLCAVDVPLSWEIDGPNDGCTIVVTDQRTGAVTRQTVPADQTTAVVSIPDASSVTIYVVCFVRNVNPDGSVVRIDGDPSNTLDVRTPGKSGNLKVRQ